MTQIPRGLKPEPPARSEFDGLLRSARRRLPDAEKESNSLESRFDLAYNAAHALALAALRWHGYRSENRYLVFQCLPHTLGVPNEQWRVLADAHNKRNRAEYEGDMDADSATVEAVSASPATSNGGSLRSDRQQRTNSMRRQLFPKWKRFVRRVTAASSVRWISTTWT